MRSSWKDFNKLNTLSIKFANSTARQATIFANGNNQVEILVTVRMTGTNGSPLYISQEELRKALYLCDYNTGRRISSPWIVTFEKGQYNFAVSYQNVMSARSQEFSVEEQSNNENIQFYLSCESYRDNSLIAVALDVPGVGVFNTTENGTHTRNSVDGKTGSRFRSPHHVNVMLVPAINYSDPKNFSIEVSNFETLATNTRWESYLSFGGPYKQHWNGKLKKRVVSIRPKTDIPNNKFYKNEFVYEPVKNADCNITGTNTTWHGVPIDRFFLIKGPSFPCAVISQGDISPDDYQVNFWYGQENHPHMDGCFHIADSNYEYRCQVQWNDGYKEIENMGIAKLYLYKVSVPLPGCFPYGYQDAIHLPRLNVIDMYGNKGSVEVFFDHNNCFNQPILR